MAISDKSFLDLATYNILAGTTIAAPANDNATPTEEYLNWEQNVNFTAMVFEQMSNRPLIAKDYSYVSTDEDYDPEYSIFDAPKGIHFYFPTYPVNSLTTFYVGDELITEALITDFNSLTNYYLYKKTGKLIYLSGFNFPDMKNIKCVWNGGYVDTSSEYLELQRLQYFYVKYLLDNESVISSNFTSETIGQYKYTKNPEKELEMPLLIAKRLGFFRRTSIG